MITTTPVRSWRSIALELARRLEAHAYCDEHEPDRPDTANCPFCQDRAAFQAFKARVDVEVAA